MNISFVMPHLNYGIGGVRRIIEVANHLKNFGHEVKIFTPDGSYNGWLENRVAVFKLQHLDKHRHDACVFTLAEQYKSVLNSKAEKKIFWVLAPEGMYKEPTLPFRALQQDFIFFTNSSFTRDYIIKNRKVSIPYEIPIIPGGLNPSHFRYDPEIKKEYHILYFGSKRPWKGKEFIERTIMSLNLKILKLEGARTPQVEMYKMYNKCNMYISACQAEGFSMPQLEAMACGCAVVTTDDGGSRDFVKNGHNAIIIPKQGNSLVDAIKTLLTSKDTRRKLIKNGLITASQKKFRWENISRKFEEAIKKS